MKKILCLFGIYRNINSFVISNSVETLAYGIYELGGGSFLYKFTDKISIGGLVETNFTQEALLFGVDSKILMYNRLFVFNALVNAFSYYYYNSNLVGSIKMLGQLYNENIFVGFNFNLFKDNTLSMTFVAMYDWNCNKNLSIRASGNILLKKLNYRAINEQTFKEQTDNSLNLKQCDDSPVLRAYEESISTCVDVSVEQELTKEQQVLPTSADEFNEIVNNICKYKEEILSNVNYPYLFQSSVDSFNKCINKLDEFKSKYSEIYIKENHLTELIDELASIKNKKEFVVQFLAAHNVASEVEQPAESDERLETEQTAVDSSNLNQDNENNVEAYSEESIRTDIYVSGEESKQEPIKKTFDLSNLNQDDDNSVLRSSEKSIPTYVTKPEIVQKLTVQPAESNERLETEQAAVDLSNLNQDNENNVEAYSEELEQSEKQSAADRSNQSNHNSEESSSSTDVDVSGQSTPNTPVVENLNMINKDNYLNFLNYFQRTSYKASLSKSEKTRISSILNHLMKDESPKKEILINKNYFNKTINNTEYKEIIEIVKKIQEENLTVKQFIDVINEEIKKKSDNK